MVTSSAPLHDLPYELKLEVLESMDCVSDLINLVRASSQYHAVYMANREAILTKVTLRLLEARQVDIFEQMCFAEMKIHANVPIQAVKRALHA